MAVKIVVPGEDQNPALQGKCHVCQGIIECLKSDIIYEDRPCGVGYVKCPTNGCYGQIVETQMKRVIRSGE